MFWALIYCFIHLCWGLLCWRKYRFPSNIQFGILLSYIIFDLWSHSKKTEIFWECLVLLMSSWLYPDLFYFNFWQEIFLWSGNMGIGLWWICASFSHLRELDPKTTGCKACNKFKLHFSSPTKMDSHKFQNYPHA